MQEIKSNPWLVAFAVSLATFMEVLDTTITNVSLSHIGGSLAASQEESTWVMTSYLVSNAIVLPLSGWLAGAIGRKKYFMLCIGFFTLASFFCGAATSLWMIIVFRLLQGIAGGGLQPTQQAILLDAFPMEKRAQVFGLTAITMIVAPVIGPTLGGWITDSYSWRWIFYINLPVGLLALYMVSSFVEDPPYLRQRFRGAIDSLGFGLMALGLGALQLVLDKGQEADWFSATWICWTAAIAVVALAAFVAREFTTAEPIVQLRVLHDRNFSVGILITTVYGGVLYGVTALLPLFLQTLLGYSALASGLAVSPRGIGSMISMVLVGVIISYVDDRLLLACGFLILGLSTLMLSRVNLEISTASVAIPNLINGMASGFIFVPHHHHHGPAAERRNGQRHRHLQPDAQYRRQLRNRPDRQASFSAISRSGRRIWARASPPIAYRRNSLSRSMQGR